MSFEHRQEIRMRLEKLQEGINILLGLDDIRWSEKEQRYIQTEEGEGPASLDEEFIREQREVGKHGSSKSSKPKPIEE